MTTTKLTMVILISCLFVSSKGNTNLEEIRGIPNHMIEGTVNNTKEILYNFNFTGISYFEKMKVKIWSGVVEESKQGSTQYPLLFTVRQRSAVTSWHLPFEYVNDKNHEDFRFYETDRILCFDMKNSPDSKNIQVTISTQSSQDLKFQLVVAATPDYIISPNSVIAMNLSSSSNFYLFRFEGKSQDIALIKINSTDSKCMIVSLQPPRCPVYTTEADVEFHGHWMTVSKSAGFSVQRHEFPNGFYLIFVATKSNYRCEEYQGIIQSNQIVTQENSVLQHKIVHLEIMIKESNPSTRWRAIVFPLLFYCAVISFIFVVFSYFHHVKQRLLTASVCENPDSTLLQAGGGKIKSSFQKHITKLTSPVKITELIKMDTARLERKSKRFYWSVIIVSIFYFLPVCQLAGVYLKVVYRTGDEDLCYYNFMCAHAYGYIKDFNHLYSNIGYVIFGLTFICFVRIKHSCLKNFEKASGSDVRNPDAMVLEELELSTSTNQRSYNDVTILSSSTSLWKKVFPDILRSKDFGVFYHFGLFYSMGIALVLQGFLSGAYHICPTQRNFQFDASFMYVLVILTIVKLYQFRHPICVNANVTFVTLALVAIWAFIGLKLDNDNTFKAIFTVFHMMTLFNLLLYQYYVGYLKINGEVATNILQVYRYALSKLKHLIVHKELRTFQRQTVRLNGENSDTCDRDDSLNYTPSRALLPTLAVIFNVGIIIANFTSLSGQNFASQVLWILILNSSVYFIYYIFMKFIHKEFRGLMWVQTLMYSVITLSFGIPSVLYFSSALTSWNKSPAESRVRNEDCFFLDFYDYHDAWHFLSAPALFCFFLVLLTVDDDLIGTTKSDIPVF